MIITKEQHWPSFDRILIFDDKDNASVILDVDKDDLSAIIWSLFVDESCRKQGIATKLIQFAENIAKSRGCKQISLKWNENMSIDWSKSWYERLGYLPKAENILMEKEL